MLSNLERPLEVVGIMVDDLSLNQLAFNVIENTHKYIAFDGKWDVCVFIRDLTPHCLPCHFSIMQFYHAYGYNGNLVATSLDSANKLITFPAEKRKFFYMWDMEWFRRPFPHKAMKHIYLNDELELIARNEEQAAWFTKAWGREVSHIVEDADVSKFIEIIKE